MNIIVFGATGPTGSEAVQQALAQGHAVTAFTRSPSAVTETHPKLCVTQGDVLDPSAVAGAIAGHDAVLCALGPRNRASRAQKPPATLASEGTRNIANAMQKHGVQRLIIVSALGVGPSRGHGGFLLERILIPLFLRHVFADKERQEEIVRASKLDWVIVQPSHLTRGRGRRRYVNKSPGGRVPGSIARADVAHFMLTQLGRDDAVRRTACIGG